MRNPQLNANGELAHLLTLEGLPREIIVRILDTAESFLGVTEREVKKVPLLRGLSVFNVFFENSTRTRTTFEIAAKRLSADVINLNISTSSTTKGETLLDTVDNLAAMHADMFVVRHAQSGAAHMIARHVGPERHVINAGDGRHAHPTQGLLDAYTIRHYKKEFTGLTVAIVGDILHSRVARSLIHVLNILGTPEVRVIAPQTLLPAGVESLGVRVHHDMRKGLAGADVVVMLRLQNERMRGALLPSAQEFFKYYGLTPEKLALAKPDAIVMHPGPMNRGIEIDSSVADGPHSVILPQVTFGIAVRMAVMSILGGSYRIMRIHIKGGRLVDPKHGVDRPADVYIAEGRVAGIGGAPKGFTADRVIDATGLVVAPGLVDLSARLREPGLEYKATLESEMLAAVAGGVTSLACPPDTDPPLDEPGLVEMLKRRASSLNLARVYPIGALTAKLEGERLTEMAELRDHGCIAFSQAEVPLADMQVLWRALQYAATFGLAVWLRPQDAQLAKSGVAHDGEVATRLGLPGIPSFAETIALGAILQLVRATGTRVHLCRLSARESVEMIRAAKRDGLAVTCDVSVHHLHLSELDLGYFDSHCHVVPPFRSQRDREALSAGLADGTIDAVCSDHTPVDDDAKQLPFGESEPGATGLELLLPLTLKWSRESRLPLVQALARATADPARILGIDAGHLGAGAPADVCIFDPETYFTVAPALLRSQGKNTPFLGYELPGVVRWTLVAGEVRFERG